MKPVVSGTYPLAEVEQALADLSENKVVGRAPVLIDSFERGARFASVLVREGLRFYRRGGSMCPPLQANPSPSTVTEPHRRHSGACRNPGAPLDLTSDEWALDSGMRRNDEQRRPYGSGCAMLCRSDIYVRHTCDPHSVNQMGRIYLPPLPPRRPRRRRSQAFVYPLQGASHERCAFVPSGAP